MKKETSNKLVTWLIFSFIGIALVAELIQNTVPTLVFLAFVAAVIYLYKFPPKWLYKLSTPGRKPKLATKGKKRKKYPFRVIDGKKKSS
ncbi:hypothetical protein MK805_04140 [Shimazuella sp. AN120528]|uniref:hypothetical protein n=1 Tax=Shimazuella soli TaxID=1892854 RepID=UPI001F0F0247|nr:hypothetical protein [Shimazuella soli]MCH5584156.1 hypothetical protein [Shimazuella soli]